MSGSSHYSANCTITIIPSDATKSSPTKIGPGTSFPFVTSVEIQRVFKLTSQITISVEAPFHEGKEMLNGPLFYTGNKVLVTMSYPDDEASILEVSGIIFKGGIGLSLTPNGISGSVTVKGTSLAGDRIKSIVVADPSTETFEWLEDVVDQAGYLGVEASDRVKGEINLITVQSNGAKPVIEHLEDFCLHNGFLFSEIFSGDGTVSILIFDEEELDKNKVKRVFIMRDSFIDTEYLKKYDFINATGAVSAKAYPIISFSPELSSGFFANREIIRVKQVGINAKGEREDRAEDEDSLKAVKRTIGSDDQEAGLSDAKAGNTVTIKALEPNEAGINVAPIYPEGKDSRAEEKRVTRIASERMTSYNASLTTFGIPEIEPGERIAVVGLGGLLDGVFLIKEVTQTWNAGKIDTTLGIYGRNNGVPE
tara:strand:+ start:636 stop:1904 length:1269 start_codon:yes stop_codon:yes gene_type:complete